VARALASSDDARREVCEAACEVAGAPVSFLLEPVGREFVSTAMAGADIAPVTIQPRGDAGASGRAFTSKETYFVADARTHPALATPLVDATEARSAVFEPVLRDGQVAGVLIVVWQVPLEALPDAPAGVLRLLAAQAAVAIENARLYESATQWSRQLESLIEVGNALATETDLDRLLDLVARRLQELLDARLVTVLLPAQSDELRFAAAAGAEGDELVGTTMSSSGSKSGRVLERRRSERVDSVLDDPEVNREITRRLAARTGLWVPLVVRDRAIGVIGVYDKPARIRASPTATSGSPRRLPRAPRSRSISPSASPVTRCAEWSPRRSSSGGGSRASSTTRPARR
jgi:GAF domain-containing protein